ncbi:cytochrome c3 family protein [Shewanella waksmanii]|uniref:cytochrome c3 family protein n=1 Tax=Shewanella waksmanii TaxID=213783 RepID=UPI00048B220F|nr:cytochrome c3 family protein [Shewanella waksmanii]
MKYLTMVAALVFAGSAVAVDCTDCHEKIDTTMHVESEATLANCADCHSIADAHEIDMDLHTQDLTITECADCHEM